MAKLVNNWDEAVAYCDKKGLKYVPYIQDYPQKVYKRGGEWGVGVSPETPKPYKDGLRIPLKEGAWQVLEVIMDDILQANPEPEAMRLAEYIRGERAVIPYEDFELTYHVCCELVDACKILPMSPAKWPIFVDVATKAGFGSIVVMGYEVSLETFKPVADFGVLKHNGKMYYIDED